jgi:quinol monooxygenase YgiN
LIVRRNALLQSPPACNAQAAGHPSSERTYPREIEMDAKQVLVIATTMLATMGVSAFGQQAREPYVRVAEIEIDPAQLEAYKAAVKEQIEAAVRLEPDVLALYSVADKDNPALVFVFEMYADLDAYKAYLDTAHFKKYKVATQDMVKSLKLRDTVPILLGGKSR